MLVLLRRDSKPLIKLSCYMYKKLYSERALITTFVDTKHFSCYETPCCFVSHQSAWTAQISNQTQLVVNRFYILFAFYFLSFTCFVIDQLSAHTHTAHTHTGTTDEESGTRLIYFCLILLLKQVRKATHEWAEVWAERLFAGAERLAEYQVDRQVDRRMAAESEHQGERLLVESHRKEAGVQVLMGMAAAALFDRRFHSIGWVVMFWLMALQDLSHLCTTWPSLWFGKRSIPLAACWDFWLLELFQAASRILVVFCDRFQTEGVVEVS